MTTTSTKALFSKSRIEDDNLNLGMFPMVVIYDRCCHKNIFLQINSVILSVFNHGRSEM